MVRVWTVGHSNHPLADFLALLRVHEIGLLADVRRFPGSRRLPHFNGPVLASALREIGVGYQHFEQLGGRRPEHAESHNTAWRVPGFRGYADYMETPPFAESAQRLITLAGRQRVALMCAEAVWWRCHRGLISDWLKAHGHEVLHITSTSKCELHPYTSAARIVDGRLSYTADEPPTLFD